MKPIGKVRIEWSPRFAYAIGLLTTDGSLSSDGRHINFTSKDRELVYLFKWCLGIDNRVGRKSRAKDGIKKYFQVQFGDVRFYAFLMRLGLMPAKTKIISKIDVPPDYFFDFLRGHFDGDGTFYSYWDPRWKSSFMFYTVFISASKRHIVWLRRCIKQKLKIRGHLTRDNRKAAHHLKYAKRESLKLLRGLYYAPQIVCLKRKRLKIQNALHTIGMRL